MTVPRTDPQELPHWADGTVAILGTGGDGPHAIPVSTGLRVGPRKVLIALAARRRSLENLRRDPRVTLTLLAEGDVAVTAHGTASVVADPMAISDRVCAVAIDVERIQDHGQPRFTVESGVLGEWTDEDARLRDAEVRRELAAIADRLRDG